MTALAVIGILVPIAMLGGVLSLNYVGCYLNVGNTWDTALQVICMY